MEMGHLYHDSYFSSLAIELAVKEKLKTREVNAREDRAMEVTSQNFHRAKLICEKNKSFEKWKVGQALRRIRERTPGLDRSLAEERARVEELQRVLLLRNGVQEAAEVSKDVLINRSSQELNTRPVLFKNPIKSYRPKDKPLNTELSRGILRQADYVRRSEHTVKALARLGCRQDKRRLDHRKCKKELLAFSKPLIDRASVILKGRDDLDVNRFLEEFEHFIIGTDRLTTDTEAESRHSNASLTTFSASGGCHGNKNKTQLVENQDESRINLSLESEEMAGFAENPKVNQNGSKNLSAKSVESNNYSVRDINSHTSASSSPSPAKCGSLGNQLYLPEGMQALPLPPIKLEIGQSLEALDSHQPMEGTGSLEGAKRNVSGNNDLAAFDGGRHNSSLSPRGPVWLPQLWRQHKKRMLHASTMPGIRRRRKISLQRM